MLAILPVSPKRRSKNTECAQSRCVLASLCDRRSAKTGNSIAIKSGVPLPLALGDFAPALGRLCPDNHFLAAFHAGILAGTRVLLGCEVFPYTMHRQYFRECIEPLVQQNARNRLPHYRYPEPLNEEPMQRRLVRANCLLHPTLAPEYLALYNSIGKGRSAVRPLEVQYG